MTYSFHNNSLYVSLEHGTIGINSIYDIVYDYDQYESTTDWYKPAAVDIPTLFRYVRARYISASITSVTG